MSFLRHMVRAMVAAMVDVGRGKLTVGEPLRSRRAEIATKLRRTRRWAASTSSKSATDSAIGQVARFRCRKPLGVDAREAGLLENHQRPPEKIWRFSLSRI